MGTLGREMPAFWVNEDKPDNRALVHRSGGPCAPPRAKNAEDGQWHGPFESKEEAVRVAQGLDRKTARDCLRCKP